MDFYLSIDGEKVGPVSIFRVSELLEAEEITADTKGWHRGLDGWRPLREISALDTVIERHGSTDSFDKGGETAEDEPPAVIHAKEIIREQKETDSTWQGPPPLPEAGDLSGVAGVRMEVRPFVRFCARMFDYTLVYTLAFLFAGVKIPRPEEGMTLTETIARSMEVAQSPEAIMFAKILIFALIGWHVLEALLVNYFGTTPGKALFGIRIVTVAGERLGVAQSLTRSFFVYVFGMGLFLSVLPIIGMLFSFYWLMARGDCLWDQQMKLRVESCRLSFGRIMLAVFLFFGILLLQTF